jgi:DNA-binding SARP family transcriptional activator
VKRLKLLGGALIESGDDSGGAITGRAVQRRRIALLALLVMRQQGLSRDKIIAYLWPDADSERGRHLLSDSVYRINQELGANTITAVADDLRLDCDALNCDVLEFQRALAAHDHARAAGVYAGPFLDGFFLSECVELERWIESERSRLGHEYQSAIESLAEVAGEAGEYARAVEWWRRAAALDPYNSRIALKLMQALAASGNRPGALQHAQIHAALVRSDFGTEPDASVSEYAERLRRGNEQPATAAVAAPAVAAPAPRSVVEAAPN